VLGEYTVPTPFLAIVVLLHFTNGQFYCAQAEHSLGIA
jgi:hypothetical protein